MTRYLPQTVVGLLFGVILAFSSFHISACTSARAQSAPALLDAGASSGSAAAPAPALHDPTKDPGQFLSDLGAAKKLGWPILVLLVAFGLLELVAYVGKNVSALAWLGKGRATIVVGGGLAVIAAAYNALASGGTWYSVGTAALFALLLYAHPAATDVAAAKASS